MNTWQTKKLGEIISLEYGKSLTERVRVSGNIPVYGSNGLVGTHNTKLVDGPGIIVGRKGSIGEVVWSDNDFWPIDTTYYARLLQNNELKYVYFLLQTLKLNSLNKASGVPGLNRNDVYRLVVKLPPLNIQQQIVEKLDAIRKLQELNNKEIEKAGELFNSLLIKLFQPQATWNRKKLGEIVQLINGRAFKPSEWKSIGIPIIRIQNLNNSEASFNYYAGKFNDKHLVRNGDLLFSWSGNLGTSFGAFIWDREDGLLNQHIYKVQIKDNDVLKKYLYFILTSLVKNIEKRTHGAIGLVHITKLELEKTMICYPEPQIQQDIINKFMAVRRYIDIYQMKKGKLSELFESTINRVMKGKLIN